MMSAANTVSPRPPILLVQEKEELILGKKYFGNSFDDLTLIACTASSIDGLREFSCQYQLSGDYCEGNLNWEGKEELIISYGLWCRRIDQIIQEEIPELSKLRLSPMIHNFAHTRLKYFQHIVTIDFLQSLAQQYSPCTAYYFPYTDKNVFLSPISEVIPLFENMEKWGIKFVPIILEEQENLRYLSACRKRNLGVTWEENVKNFPDFVSPFGLAGKTYRSAVTAWLKKQAEGRLRFTTPINKAVWLLQAISFGRVRLDGQNILILVSARDHVAPILRTLRARRKRINFVFWDELVPDVTLDFVVPVERILDRIKSDDYIRSNFVCWKDVDYFKLIVPAIRKTVETDIGVMYRAASLFRRLHTRIRIDAVVAAYETAPFEAIFQQCSSLKIPHVVFSHGGNIGTQLGAPVHQRYVRDGSNFHIDFVFADVARKYLEDLSGKYGVTTKVVNVGSPYFYSLWQRQGGKGIRKKRTTKRLQVCFVVGAFTRVSDCNVGILHNSNMYDLTVEVVNLLSREQEIDVFVKCGYGIERYGLDLFESSVAKNNLHFISSSQRIRDIMPKIDVFLLPYISSPFYELSCTSIPIIMLYDKRAYALPEKTISLMRKRAVFAETKNEFLKETKNLIELGRLSAAFDHARCQNMEYCRTYNLFEGRNPTEWGADQLIETINSSKIVS